MDTKLLKIRGALDDATLQLRVAGAQLGHITTTVYDEGTPEALLADAVRDDPTKPIANLVTELILNPSVQAAITWDAATESTESSNVTDSDIEFVVADRWSAVAARLYGQPAS